LKLSLVSHGYKNTDVNKGVKQLTHQKSQHSWSRKAGTCMEG